MINKIPISEADVYSIAFNRNVSTGLIKSTQIHVAEDMWVKSFISEDFYNELTKEENLEDYYSFIDNYIKPIIAWGVLYNNYDYLTQNVTDKGIIQMLVEGTATVIDRNSRFDGKMEIKRTVYRLIKMMQEYGLNEKIKENALFKDFDITKLSPAIIKYHGGERTNLKPH